VLIELHLDEQNLQATCGETKLDEELLIRRVQAIVTEAARNGTLDRLAYNIVYRPVHGMFLAGPGQYVDGNLVLRGAGRGIVQVGALATEEVRPIRKLTLNVNADGAEHVGEYVVVCTLLTRLPSEP
jgi:hypothetical protein